nr:hypothetical protein Iba_chr12bCG2740 [Ipomoea batatas]
MPSSRQTRLGIYGLDLAAHAFCKSVDAELSFCVNSDSPFCTALGSICSTGTASIAIMSAIELEWTNANPLLTKYFFTSFPSCTDTTPGFSSAIVATCPGRIPICPVVAGGHEGLIGGRSGGEISGEPSRSSGDGGGCRSVQQASGGVTDHGGTKIGDRSARKSEKWESEEAAVSEASPGNGFSISLSP